MKLLRWVAPALTLVLLVAAGVTAQQLGWVDTWLDDTGTASGDTTSAAEPWDVAVPSPAPVAAPALAPRPAAVRRALRGQLAGADLGPHVAVEVAGLSGDPVVVRGSGPVTPASTAKLLTTAAALHVLGPEATFATTLVSPAAGRLVLVGGGDPLLASAPSRSTRSASLPRADLTTLATRAAATLTAAGTTSVTLGYDESLFTGPATSPTWPDSYVTDSVVSPVSALRADEGITADGGRDLTPALSATRTVAAVLRAHGVAVTGRIRPATGSGSQVATVSSAPLRQIVEHTLETSDNDAAEVLSHQVGARAGDGSFDGGARAVEQALSELGVPLAGLTLYDGSGLSRSDRATPAALTAVLRAATTDPDLQVLDYGLPVAGFSGSLAGRYAEDSSAAGEGTVRAKTGTLTGVSGLAGFVTTADGVSLTYVVIADAVPVVRTLAARRALDDAAAALAACTCAASG